MKSGRRNVFKLLVHRIFIGHFITKLLSCSDSLSGTIVAFANLRNDYERWKRRVSPNW